MTMEFCWLTQRGNAETGALPGRSEFAMGGAILPRNFAWKSYLLC